MATQNFRIIYDRSEFLALSGSIQLPVLTTTLLGLSLTSPIVDIRRTPSGNGVAVEWESLVSEADIDAVDDAIATFVGAATTSDPFVQTNAGPVTASNSTPVSVIDFTTPPLDFGTYDVKFSSMYRLVNTSANTAARAISIVNGSQQMTHWGEAVVSAYNGSGTLQRLAGQTIRVQLQIAKVGAGAVTAEMTGARISIDKVS